jgi:hypothetical protein
MTLFRRVRSNFALQRALEWGQTLKRPVVVLESLKVDYPYASERLHAFMLQGMAENARRLKGTAVLHHPWSVLTPGADEGMVAAFAARACVVVADDWPAFFLPKYLAETAAPLDVRFEVVDSNGLLPLAATDRVFSTAFSFRAFLQKELPKHLHDFPVEDPVAAADVPRATPALLKGVAEKWPAASAALLEARPEALAALPLEHRVEDPSSAAAVVHARLVQLAQGGMLLAQPPPAEAALPREQVEAEIRRALEEAGQKGISGKAVTPFLLGRVAALTGGRSLAVNLALLVHNARLAAEVAVALAELERH